MKKSMWLIIPFTVLFLALSLSHAGARQCSETLTKAMREEGLSQNQINAICAKAEMYSQRKNSVFTPEKIRGDLIGKGVGPDAAVKVRTGSRQRSQVRSGSSYDVITTVPLGLVFDDTNISQVTVLDEQIKGNKALVVAHVDTVSQYAGRLRLHYELIAGEWTLLEIENLDFRQQ